MKSYFKKLLMFALLFAIPALFGLSNHVSANITIDEIFRYYNRYCMCLSDVKDKRVDFQDLISGLSQANIDAEKCQKHVSNICLYLGQIKCLSEFLSEQGEPDVKISQHYLNNVCERVDKVIKAPKVPDGRPLYSRLESLLMGLRDEYLVFDIDDYTGLFSDSGVDVHFAYAQYYDPEIESICREILALS